MVNINLLLNNDEAGNTPTSINEAPNPKPRETIKRKRSDLLIDDETTGPHGSSTASEVKSEMDFSTSSNLDSGSGSSSSGSCHIQSNTPYENENNSSGSNSGSQNNTRSKVKAKNYARANLNKKSPQAKKSLTVNDNLPPYKVFTQRVYKNFNRVESKEINNKTKPVVALRIPRSQVDPKYFKRELVEIAIRRKAANKKQQLNQDILQSHPQNFESLSKLHIKSLEAGLRVKLTMVPSLVALYKHLTPNDNIRNVHIVEESGEIADVFDELLSSEDSTKSSSSDEDRSSFNRQVSESSAANKRKKDYVDVINRDTNMEDEYTPKPSMVDSCPVDSPQNSTSVLSDSQGHQILHTEENNSLFQGAKSTIDDSNNGSESHKHKTGTRKSINIKNDKPYRRGFETRHMQLIDQNFNTAGFSNKILQSFKKDTSSKSSIPIFNSLDTAVRSLYGINEYTLVRVTRSSSNDSEGSILLKLECANPGSLWLLDEENFFEEMYYSLGKKGDVPNSLFIKKVVARPRYKADMKLYLIPKKSNSALYVDPRMFERDLIKGVIDYQDINRRPAYCCFPYKDILKHVCELIHLTKAERVHDETEIEASEQSKSSQDDDTQTQSDVSEK